LQDSIKSLDNRREDIGRRLTQIEARYRRQFTSLDTLMSNMSATQSSLTQQLARLNK
jgi:flagellar hook-associated protein 2